LLTAADADSCLGHNGADESHERSIAAQHHDARP
jgi:hypothetical protein